MRAFCSEKVTSQLIHNNDFQTPVMDEMTGRFAQILSQSARRAEVTAGKYHAQVKEAKVIKPTPQKPSSRR
jgi:hypothetical protein